ncbi:unnamed protein product [Hyaloperonospora brassicae]|uniref:Heterogeneous nuclear ribonucleoprotein Q acidic domain-containing protein n=1 Tax=Hyaloperonospora brassicae TaxID=162125 RepID=A0AAV0T0D1_HYABA|nr:unnamed protein product [Hyaloperonospora brassicae]
MALDALGASDCSDAPAAVPTEQAHDSAAQVDGEDADRLVSAEDDEGDEEEEQQHETARGLSQSRDGTEDDAMEPLRKAEDNEPSGEVATGESDAMTDETMEEADDLTLDAAASVASDLIALERSDDTASIRTSDLKAAECQSDGTAEQRDNGVEDIGDGSGNGCMNGVGMPLPEVASTTESGGANDDDGVVATKHNDTVDHVSVCASVAPSVTVDTVLPAEPSTPPSKKMGDSSSEERVVENDESMETASAGDASTSPTPDMPVCVSASHSVTSESIVASGEPLDTSKETNEVVCEKQSAQNDDSMDTTGEDSAPTMPTRDVPGCDSASLSAAGESTTAPVQPSVPSSKETSDISSEEQQAENVDTGDNVVQTTSPHTLDEDECDTLAPVAVASCVPHGDDEYDPANPSSAETPVRSDNTTSCTNHPSAAEKEEYDPEHPFVTPSAPNESVAMEVSAVTPAKRKADDETNSPSDGPEKGCEDSKRLRCNSDIKSPRDGDHKQGRHRRGSGDTTLSSSSKKKNGEDGNYKGLSAAAWDRLMDFQTSGEFRVTQVSRAAFASVGAMPEFAQIAIIARFVRTPMREIRDKNGQLMRIYREYQKENPQVAALQPVDAFISDSKSDSGLFRFGYAPPQPATGTSTVQVPYQRDQLPDDVPVRISPRHARNKTARSDQDMHPHKNVDEFGRAVHLNKELADEPTALTYLGNERSVADPPFSAQNREASSVHATPPTVTKGRAEDPRRREQPRIQNGNGAGRDPRRHSSVSNRQTSPRGGLSYAAGSSDLYERLSAPVRAVVDSMRREGRLQESLNDNVITRLLHLPERVALQAVENFSNVDLSQVENLQGFLVGIINRVNEKAIASEKLHRPQVPSPRGRPAPAGPNGGRNYGAPAQHVSVLGGPPQGGRLNSNNGVNGDGYQGQLTPMTADPTPSPYDRSFDAPQDTRDPRRRQPAPQVTSQYGGAVRAPQLVGTGHGPIGMHSFTVLPVSVQNHIHALVADRTLASLEELGGKCYEVLGQLSEPLANQVLTRFAGANLSNVRNKSGFLIGVVKRARQEYGFN